MKDFKLLQGQLQADGTLRCDEGETPDDDLEDISSCLVAKSVLKMLDVGPRKTASTYARELLRQVFDPAELVKKSITGRQSIAPKGSMLNPNWTFLRRLLRHLLEDGLACQFSWLGKKGKRAFNDLRLRSCLISAVKRGHDANDYVVEAAVHEWLRQTPARHHSTTGKVYLSNHCTQYRSICALRASLFQHHIALTSLRLAPSTSMFVISTL
ncbi:hypothetical protein V5799_022078 [Amblyomma americanum]|uniref:DUF4806 domain-containing protein n=1 Tax=Amblyomma americanum TaxID=6943 RepID=A0AAQ4FLH1_AMBAM